MITVTGVLLYIISYFLVKGMEGSLPTVIIVFGIIHLWSWGVLHNYKDSPSVDSNYEHFIVTLNMVTTLGAVVLFIITIGR